MLRRMRRKARRRKKKEVKGENSNCFVKALEFSGLALAEARLGTRGCPIPIVCSLGAKRRKPDKVKIKNDVPIKVVQAFKVYGFAKRYKKKDKQKGKDRKPELEHGFVLDRRSVPFRQCSAMQHTGSVRVPMVGRHADVNLVTLATDTVNAPNRNGSRMPLGDFEI